MILEIQCTIMWIDLPLNCTWKPVYLCYVEFPIFLALRESCGHVLSGSATVWWAEVTVESALSLGSCFRFPGGKMSSYRSSSLSIRTLTHNNCTIAIISQVVITPNVLPPRGLPPESSSSCKFLHFSSFRAEAKALLSEDLLHLQFYLQQAASSSSAFEKSWQSLCGLST